MALKTGEQYKCPDSECGCEIEVTRGAKTVSRDNDRDPQCCCGEDMSRVSEPSRSAQASR
jgi:hypothetical protein